MSNFYVKSKSTQPVFAFVCLLATGCGNQASDKLVGTWEMQKGEHVAVVSRNHENKLPGNNLPDDSPTIADNTNSIVDGVGGGDNSTGTMSLVFQRNGSLATITDFSAARSEKHWHWSLVSWDKESASAVIRCQMPPETVETSIQFIDNNTIELVPPNIDVLKTRLRFVRK